MIEYNPTNTLLASNGEEIVHKSDKKEFAYLMQETYKWLK